MDATQQELNRRILPKLEETDHPDNAKRMLRAAVQLFARKGYKGTSVREIVQSAEVTNPMLYYYFDDKQGLFDTLLEYLFDILGSDIADEMPESGSLEATIDGIIRGYFRACRRSPVAMQFVYTVFFGPTEGTPQLDIFELREPIFETITDRIEAAKQEDGRLPEEGFDTEYLGEQLLGLISNHLMRVMQEAERGDGLEVEVERRLTESEATDLRNFFLEGAGYAAS